jgi:hypothetical protein
LLGKLLEGAPSRGRTLAKQSAKNSSAEPTPARRSKQIKSARASSLQRDQHGGHAATLGGVASSYPLALIRSQLSALSASEARVAATILERPYAAMYWSAADL